MFWVPGGGDAAETPTQAKDPGRVHSKHVWGDLSVLAFGY